MKDKSLIPRINALVKQLGLSGDQLKIGLQIYGPVAFHRMLSVMKSGTKSWKEVKQEGVVDQFKKLLDSFANMDLSQDDFDLLSSTWSDFAEAFLTSQEASVSGKQWRSLTKGRGRKAKKELDVMGHYFGSNPITQTKSQQEHSFERSKS